MSPIALALNLVLVLLLVSALGFGLRLDRRLKALKEGQASFVGAVADLDQAARRAEAGLAELRAATEEAVDLLAGRIEKARELSTRLEKLTSDAARLGARPAAETPRPPPAAAPRVRNDEPLILDRADAAAEDLVLRLTEREPIRPAALSRQEPPRTDYTHSDFSRPEPRPTPRSRAVIDDDLFEGAPSRAAGGRR